MLRAWERTTPTQNTGGEGPHPSRNTTEAGRRPPTKLKGRAPQTKEEPPPKKNRTKHLIQKFILVLSLLLTLGFALALRLDPGHGLGLGVGLRPGLVLAMAPVLVMVQWRWVADGWWL